jgi:NADH dehydrogenase
MPFAYDPGVNDIQTTDLNGMKNLINAATRAGVGRFIYTSFSANLDIDFPLARAKRAVETHLVESGMDYTILRPSFFMDVWLSPAVGFDPGNGKITVYGDGTRPISYIASADVAAFAVASLSVPDARNAVLELGGPEALSQLDAKAIFEGTIGRPITTQLVPVEALEEQAANATDGMQQSFVSLMLCAAKGDVIDMSSVLTALPVHPTTVMEFAQAAV